MESTAREALKVIDWVVFIEGPPSNTSKAEHVLKYLARYITGGPIANSRLIDNADGEVRFWARSTDKSKKGERVMIPLSGVEFVRRWALHILPKGFTRSRFFGGWSNTRRKAYQELCGSLSPTSKSIEKTATADPPPIEVETDQPEDQPRKCPKCDHEMDIESSTHRPSWRELCYGEHHPSWWRIFGSG